MAVSTVFVARFFGVVLKIILFLLTPIFWLTSLRPHKRVPPISDKLLLVSATKLAEDIRNGKIKSEDVTRAYLKRIREVNPILNAAVEMNDKAAIEEARAVDQCIAKKEKKPEQLAKEKPLFGVPITVKESCSVKGLSYTGGNLYRKGIKAEKDGDAVALMRQAGAIILAVTNTPELCSSCETKNLVYGRTVNPYDTNRTCAGSSGGEGSLLGAGASVVGLGSDLAGSIRIPAMFNGIFGHKPTAYATPFGGHFPNSKDKIFCDLAVIGPITRYAQDMKLVMKILAKSKENVLNLDSKVNINKLNIFYKESASNALPVMQVDEEIKDALHTVVKYFNNLGTNVLPANFLGTYYNQEICCTYLSLLRDNERILREMDSSLATKNLLIEDVKALFGFSKFTYDTISVLWLTQKNYFIPRSRVDEYMNEAKRMRDILADILSTNGVLLYPTYPTPAFLHNQVCFKGDGLFYAMIVNIWGFPATHVPLGLNKMGLPIGIQVIAGPNQDRLCLAVAEELEKKFGGWVPPTKILV